MTRKFLPFASVLIAALMAAGVNAPAHGQSTTAPSPTNSTYESAVAHPWDSLNASQRDMLAPLQKTWDTLSPRRQTHMLRRSEKWATLPAEKREEIREHIAHWQEMTPEQRKQARENRHKFDQLSPEQRAQLHATYEHFQQLPAAQRDQLMRQWHALPPQKRLQWSERHNHAPVSTSNGGTTAPSGSVPADPKQP